MKFPDSDLTLLIRTDFSNQPAWLRMLNAVSIPSPDGFLANLHFVDDPHFESVGPEELALKAGNDTQHALLVVADQTTMRHAEMPLLCVDPVSPKVQFRCIPAELWGVENNVSLANMDFSEFVAAVDYDGIFRGFSR